MEIHHDRHHKAYVDGCNKTLDRLVEAREKSDYDNIVGLEKALAFNLSGHVLHTLFWQNLSPSGGDKPTGDLASAIDEHFGLKWAWLAKGGVEFVLGMVGFVLSRHWVYRK